MHYGNSEIKIEKKFKSHIKELGLIKMKPNKFIDSSISIFKSLNLDDIFKKSTHNLNITFKDKITNWTGLYDKKLNFVNCNKSDLLAKRNVKNYIVTRKLYNYRQLETMFSNISVFVDNNIALFSGVINSTHDSDSLSRLKQIDSSFETGYKELIYFFIDDYLCGRKKDVLYNKLYATLLGDGISAEEFKGNFQNIPFSLSTLIDWAYSFTNAKSNGYTHEYELGKFKKIVDETTERSTSKINALYNIAKNNKNMDRVALITKYYNITKNNNKILLTKMDEVLRADSDCYFEQSESIVNVLIGLYEYQGD